MTDATRDMDDGCGVEATPPSLHRTSPPRPTAPAGRSATSAERNAARQAERRLVVYLDEAQRRWLRGVEADALVDGVRLSASAIVRLAIDELRARHVGWQELATRHPVAGDQPDEPSS